MIKSINAIVAIFIMGLFEWPRGLSNKDKSYLQWHCNKREEIIEREQEGLGESVSFMSLNFVKMYRK